MSAAVSPVPDSVGDSQQLMSAAAFPGPESVVDGHQLMSAAVFPGPDSVFLLFLIKKFSVSDLFCMMQFGQLELEMVTS